MIRYLVIFLVLMISLGGCLVVKHDDEKDKPVIISLSPQPELQMSDIMVRSESGDMLAFLPKGWFLINIEEKAPADVLCVAVNPDYTLSAVFSNIKKTSENSAIVQKEGLLGLARVALERRTKKTGGSVHQLGRYSTVKMGPRTFAKYEFANADNTMRGVASVYKTTLDEYYEMSIIPVNLTGIVPASREDIESVFNSIMATIQY
jgi:hypothetical protein